MKKSCLLGAAFAASLVFSLPSYAAPVTLVGDTINYEYDDAQAALGLFGVPTIVGDTVRFLPPSFRAESVYPLGGTGTLTDITTAYFLFDRVYSQDEPGHEGHGHGPPEIVELLVQERGDYEITNGDSVSGDLYLLASSNVDLSDFVDGTDSFDASGDSGGLQIWNMGVSILPADAFLDSANDMAVGIQNTLTATTDASGETAWIQKKIFLTAGTAPIVPVPVPAAVWLFGSGLLGLVGIARRRKKA